MRTTLGKAISISILMCLLSLVGTVPAQADFLDFTVVEGTVPGANTNTITVDKLNGGYAEVITFTGTDFSTSAYANFSAYYSDEGTILVGSQLSCIFVQCYDMYALFYSTGSVVGGNLVGATAEVTVYLDPNQDTILTTAQLPGTGGDPIAPGGLTVDDYDIMFSNDLIAGQGIPGVPGAFNLIFGTPILTAEGQLYWPTLAGLTLTAQINGDFDVFQFTGTQIVTGDLSAVFQDAAVPEPATLTLLGIGLLGSGFASRRRARKV